MPSPRVSGLEGNAIRDVQGRVTTRAAANLPQSAYGALFTISGGTVVITQIVGIVTTAVQAQATTLKFTATPTTGTANDLSGTVDMNNAEIGSLVSMVGLAATGATGGPAKSGGVSSLAQDVIVNIGTLGITTGASSTGQMRWVIQWYPLETGAQLVAA